MFAIVNNYAKFNGWQGGLTDNKDYQNKRARIYNKNKRDTDPLFKLAITLRNRINSALKNGGYKKQSHAQVLLGADFNSVKSYIESKFKDGMTWENHGRELGKWNFDHIVPCASAKSEEELISLFHYTNIQPLWWIENISKGSLHNGKRYYRKNRGDV